MAVLTSNGKKRSIIIISFVLVVNKSRVYTAVFYSKIISTYKTYSLTLILRSKSMISIYTGCARNVLHNAILRISFMIKMFKNISLLSAISFACAIHCLLTPFLLMFVPFFGHYFDNIWIEILIIIPYNIFIIPIINKI